MASYIKTLKEDNGDITYPQTLGSAVLLTGGADLETELAGKATTTSVNNKISIGDVQSTDIVSNAVTTAKIDSGAVITSKIGDYAVTTNKIDAGAITTVKIAGSAVTDAKLAHDANFSSEKKIGKVGNNYLYKLIFSDTSASAVNTWKALSTTISTTNLVGIVSIKGTIKGSGATEYYPMNSDGANFIVYFSGGTFSERHSGSYYNSKAIYVEVEFLRSV